MYHSQYLWKKQQNTNFGLKYEPMNGEAIQRLEREKASVWIWHLMKYAEKQIKRLKQYGFEWKALDGINQEWKRKYG